MTDRLVDLENGLAYSVNDQPEQRAALESLGLPADLDAAERNTWRRFLPGGKLRWHELAGYEQEIGKLEQRRSEAERRRIEQAEELRLAPERDAQVLATWQRDAQSGQRPEPSGPRIEAELKQLQEDELALIRAVDEIIGERAAYVEKNREKFTKDAAQAEDRARQRALRAVDELEQAREGLVEARRPGCTLPAD